MAEKNMRNKYIYELFKNGSSCAAIGRDFDLSRERIRKICDKQKEAEVKKIRQENELI